MILIILFVLLCIICRVNCDLDNYGNEEISLLILAAADNNGEIAAYKNNNKWYYKTVYNGKKNNRKCYESIVDIIPELRRLYDKECRKAGIAIHSPRQRIFGTVEDYFRDELYPAALRTYNKYFSGVSNTNDVERRIKKYDLFGKLTENSKVGAINIYDKNIDVDIIFPDNDKFYNSIASYIKDNKNGFDKVNFNGPLYLNNEKLQNIPENVLYKIVELCIEDKDSCKNYFENSDTNKGKIKYLSDVNFVIVKSKINNVERYHFFTARNASNNIKNRKMAHQFTVKYNSQTKSYENDNDYRHQELDYKQIESINNNYGKTLKMELLKKQELI